MALEWLLTHTLEREGENGSSPTLRSGSCPLPYRDWWVLSITLPRLVGLVHYLTEMGPTPIWWYDRSFLTRLRQVR
uniref:Uncharacterized protein n=1 Tax=Picea glauca TaxID=3330 RepID=A0A101M3W6_PICGL|nr:hypothetical protein ABT39_MTgene255 [Picea glauca]